MLYWTEFGYNRSRRGQLFEPSLKSVVYLRGLTTHLCTVSSAFGSKNMHSHSELTRDKLPWTRQLANNILCIPPSRLPHHLHSYDLSSVIAMFNYGLSHFDSGGEENKAWIYPEQLNSSVSRKLGPFQQPACELSWFSEGESENGRNQFWPDFFFLPFFFFCFFLFCPYLKQRLPNCIPAGWTGSRLLESYLFPWQPLDQLNTSTEGDT